MAKTQQAQRKAEKTATKPGAKLDHPLGRKLDAAPDRIDIRDWFYQPTLEALPDKLVNCQRVPEILDQGKEGACTGFALGAVINFLLAQHGRKHGVSPRMLYELARRYDEWPGEDYEGSSARGAMKGWMRHGVCPRAAWPDRQQGAGHFSAKIAQEGLLVPGGAYYRVKHREVRDMHAAINETGILYVTLMVHQGWMQPGPHTVSVEYARNGKTARLKLPVIARQGRAESGHAVALVGYTHQGFIVQNSWGEKWGAGGFALLPYEDYLLHATDVWVAQLGVPVSMDLWAQGQADVTAGLQRAARAIPLEVIRPFVIDVENNGELSNSGDYWTTEEDLARLFAHTIPERTQTWKKRRVMLYLHGGLNAERDAAKRIMALRDVLLENEIYPLHVMWESDFLNSAIDLLKDRFTQADERAGGGFLDNLNEARDRVLELTLAKPAGALWGEMKENAELASHHRAGRGAMQLLAKYVELAKAGLGKAGGPPWELHVVGHSAGSIFAAHAMPILTGLGVPLKSVQFLAPAIRCDVFRETLLPGIQQGALPLPSLYLLSDEQERGDTVGPYGKSLLYLVSNAFEGARGVPLLGMQKCVAADAALAVSGTAGAAGSRASSRSHGGFDNDPDTLNSVLTRILGGAPKRLFTARELKY
jgi:hypothetical protein